MKGCEFDLIQDPSISKFKRLKIEYSSYLVKGKNKNPEYILGILKKYGLYNQEICHVWDSLQHDDPSGQRNALTLFFPLLFMSL